MMFVIDDTSHNDDANDVLTKRHSVRVEAGQLLETQLPVLWLVEHPGHQHLASLLDTWVGTAGHEHQGQEQLLWQTNMKQSTVIKCKTSRKTHCLIFWTARG